MAPEIETAPVEQSLGDDRWSAVFQDPTLVRLIREVIADNLDLHIAAQRVLEASAQVGITPYARSRS
jgi:outer membrane protein, multidrug efflux system